MKTSKIIFWTSTLIIFIMEGVIPGFTSQPEMAKQGISLWAVDGITPMLLLPVVFLGILALSYQHYHKLTNTTPCR